MTSAKDVLRIAVGEIGYNRWNDPESGTKYGRWYAQKTGDSYYGESGVPYCAMFVSWVFDQAGQSVAGLPGAYCPYIKRDGVNVGINVNKYNAQAGDIVLFDWGGDGVCDHVGIVEVNCGSYVQTIEGNTSSGQSGSQSNGGGVYRRTRSWSSVNCVLRPSYGASSGSTPKPSGPVTVPDQLDVDGYFGRNTIAKLQSVLGTPVDGIVSSQPIENKRYLAACVATDAWDFTSKCGGGSQMITKLQEKIGTTPDGWFGPNSVKCLQSYLGTTVDGELSESSSCVMELQRRLNAGTFLSGAANPVRNDTLDVDGWFGPDTISALQKQLGTPVDGIVSGQSSSNRKYYVRMGSGWEFSNGGSQMIQKLQQKCGESADGYFGPSSIASLQRFLGVSQDGYCGEQTVKALQNAINANKFA